MPLFRVKAGQHIAADPDWQPSEAEIKAQEATGNPPKAPSKVYSQGDIVESDTDLVARFGEKFEMVGESRRGRRGPSVYTLGTTRLPGDPTPENLRESPSKAPHGQVSTGHPQAETSPQQHYQGVRERPADADVVEASEHEQLEALDATAESEGAVIDDPSRPPGFKEGNGGKGSDLPKGKRIVEQYGDLDQYTVNDLKSLAESEKIDLAGATRKDEIIKTIKKAK
jgi:hypothetical protein